MYNLFLETANEKLSSSSAKGMIEENKLLSATNQELLTLNQKKERMIQHLYQKNSKKFMHLYELEKYFN